jgi:Domain of unknown function (DUF4340)
MVHQTGRMAWRRWRGLLVWAVLLLVLGAYLWLVDLPRERTAQHTAQQADKLLDFDAGAATALVLTTADATISLTKDRAEAWQILSPLKTAADQAAVRALLSRLSNAGRLRVIDEQPTILARYGLAPPTVSLRITVGGIEHQVDFGDKSPVGSSAYARVLPAAGTGRAAADGASAPVLLVPLELKKAADKRLFDLRKKGLFDVAAADVTAVELRYPDQSPPLIRLERQVPPTTGAGHPAVAWQLVAPIRAPADDDAVRVLVDEVSALQATAILDTGKAEKLATLKRLKAEITLHAGIRSMGVKFYFPFGEEAAYAVTTPEAPLYQVNRESVLQFEKSLFDLRDKRLVRLGRETVRRLRVDRPVGSYQLIRRGKAWLYNEQPISTGAAGKVHRFLDTLWQAKVEKIAGRSATAWQKFGLGDSATVITLFGGDNSATQPVVVRLGKMEGELLYLRRGSEVESYITSSPLSDLLPSDHDL